MKQNNRAKGLISCCVKGQRRFIFINSVLNVLLSVTYIALAWVSKDILDIATAVKSGSIVTYAATLLAMVIFQLLCYMLCAHLNAVITGRMSIMLKKRIFNNLFTKSYSFVSDYHSGELLNRFSSDSEIIVSTAASIIPNLLATAAKLISGAAALIILDWKFASGLIILGIAVPTLARLVGAKYKKLHKEHQNSVGKSKSFFQEIIKNLPVVKSFISLAPVKSKLQKLMKASYALSIKRNYYVIAANSAFYLFFTAGYFLAVIWGATGIKEGIITYGSLLAFLQIISQLKSPMQNISGFLPKYYSMLASAERLTQLEELPDELLPASQKVLDVIKDVFTEINVQNLCFTYSESEGCVFADCSFQIKKGSVTVLTGESGKGKSTFFRLLLGYFTPTKGSINFNGKYEINASTRGMFAYVPQGNMILSGSIRENITLCRQNVSEDEINAAIDCAVLKEWTDTLENGLDTVIGENGMGVSEGQAQRIAVARALLCDTPILLLDEATSALDSQTEDKLLHNIKALTDKTVIMVTHRKVPADICDNALHLSDSRICHTN